MDAGQGAGASVVAELNGEQSRDQAHAPAGVEVREGRLHLSRALQERRQLLLNRLSSAHRIVLVENETGVLRVQLEQGFQIVRRPGTAPFSQQIVGVQHHVGVVLGPVRCGSDAVAAGGAGIASRALGLGRVGQGEEGRGGEECDPSAGQAVWFSHALVLWGYLSPLPLIMACCGWGGNSPVWEARGERLGHPPRHDGPDGCASSISCRRKLPTA